MSSRGLLTAVVAMLLVAGLSMSMQVPPSGTVSAPAIDLAQDCEPINGIDPLSGVNPDTDGDGVWDLREAMIGTDPTNPDTDGDGLWDGLECEAGTDPSSRDTDGDGLWDGQEVKKYWYDDYYTGTDPLKRDTDGDGVGDFEDDEDDDYLPNGAEWTYDEATGCPRYRTRPRTADWDGDGVPDGYEVYGNPLNGNQTSNPRLRDTDNDRLTDDLDPRTWIKDYLPFSRIRGNSDAHGPVYPACVARGVPFTVEGWVEFNRSSFTGGTTGAWHGIYQPMLVQVWIIQDRARIPISEEVVTGDQGAFSITCIIGDDVTAGEGMLAITTTHYQKVVYGTVLWDELRGNHIL